MTLVEMQIGRFTPSAYEQVAVAATSSVDPVAPVTAPAAVKPAAAEVDHHAFQDTIFDDVPPAPTAEARKMVDQAAERVEELHKRNRELHFSRDEVSNRVVIEVRDLEGNVIKTIPPAKVLDIMSGAEL
jgi:flagellar protein FlaG